MNSSVLHHHNIWVCGYRQLLCYDNNGISMADGVVLKVVVLLNWSSLWLYLVRNASICYWRFYGRWISWTSICLHSNHISTNREETNRAVMLGYKVWIKQKSSWNSNIREQAGYTASKKQFLNWEQVIDLIIWFIVDQMKYHSHISIHVE